MEKVFSNYNIWFVAVIMFITGCKKEIESTIIESDSFLHMYPAPGDQFCSYVKPTPDNGFLIFGNGDPMSTNGENTLMVIKTNERGDLVSKTRIGDSISSPLFTELNDGSVLFSSAAGQGNLGKMDKNGDVHFITKYIDDGPRFLSYPVQLKNGSYLVTYTNGNHTVSASYNGLVSFSADGALSGRYSFPDASFGVKILYLSLFKCDTFGTYYFNGWCFTNWTGDWYRNRQLFVAKQVWNGPNLVSNDVKIIDPLNEANTNENMFQLVTKDKHLILLATQKDLNNVYKGRLIKVDEHLNILWERDLKISTKGNYCWGISECPDGNYLVTGTCKIEGKSSDQPFAAKIDRSGNVIWSKIYATSLTGVLYTGVQLLDGSCLLGGNTTGFGKGTSVNDIFVMKTDKDGNLK